eukprot:TRINITY_DN7591_c0_g1_i1.p1 TRINITY_DN7591_c0_g1~~TRINITY_DN7591_c0_g1_i1.p1  ORF type:complete len:323 (-),score=85.25 TRINITY_DN7591_c0_g1_i1:96-1031(-)
MQDEVELNCLLDPQQVNSASGAASIHPVKASVFSKSNVQQPVYVQVETNDPSEIAEMSIHSASSSSGVPVFNRLQSAFNQIMILKSKIHPLFKNMDIASHQVMTYNQTIAEELVIHAGIVEAGVSESVDRETRTLLKSGTIEPQEFQFVRSSKFHYAKDALHSYKRLETFRAKVAEYEGLLKQSREEFEASMKHISVRMKIVMKLFPKAKLPMHLDEDFEEMQLAFLAFERDQLSLDAFNRFHEESEHAFSSFEKFASAKAAADEDDDEEVDSRRSRGGAAARGAEYGSSCFPRVQNFITCRCCWLWQSEL